MFALDDRRIQYPHAEIEHVPVTWLLLYAGAFPFLILLTWSFVFFKEKHHKTHVTLLGFGISLLVTLFVTDVSFILILPLCLSAAHSLSYRSSKMQ